MEPSGILGNAPDPSLPHILWDLGVRWARVWDGWGMGMGVEWMQMGVGVGWEWMWDEDGCGIRMDVGSGRVWDGDGCRWGRMWDQDGCRIRMDEGGDGCGIRLDWDGCGMGVGCGWILPPGKSRFTFPCWCCWQGQGPGGCFRAAVKAFPWAEGPWEGRWHRAALRCGPQLPRQSIQEWEVLASWDTASSSTAFPACLRQLLSVMPPSQPLSDCPLRNSPC